ncbi:ABC transporter ATP-binding protein [Rhizobium glycinendophyticum]|uniref:ABC transporter ATP-binding protein n=1 Tax=Rhizobium glycinendophyticum TaxID=2589807 RepID=A0A504TQF9_9HYPH|nr:ABC transporter ATP-binding protein [Rhizobium glycinendophyticum]TPP05018.1 ABC transporter ATP-binding protein [Rhizobium glycinendophyticum]
MHTETEPLLKVEGVSRRFGGLMAVNALNLEVRPGEIFGLIGPNGAGKSTTFNVISGFMSPTVGKVTFAGQELPGGRVGAASKAGLVRTFQHGSYVRSMSVGDNIRLGTLARIAPSRRAEKVRETAALLGLTDVVDELAGNLSHGLQRLVSIAIAIAAAPKLLCLDEPLTGLNETEVATVLRVLDGYRKSKDRAILLVEHNMKAVMTICDRIHVLHHGEFLAAGTPVEIQSSKAVIEAYLGAAHAV